VNREAEADEVLRKVAGSLEADSPRLPPRRRTMRVLLAMCALALATSAPVEAGVGWSRLPSPPVTRASSAAVWTSSFLVVWGGDTGNDAVHHADGAIYDAASARWHRLPAAPVSGSSQAGIVWTGKEVLVWGGIGDGYLSNDGARLDPVRRRWRRLPPSPLSSRIPVATVWTGTELLVWGETARERPVRDGAAYDPVRNRWRRIASAPVALNEATAAWTGEEMIVYGSLLDGGNHSRANVARGIAYDPARDRWRRLPRFPLSPQASAVTWTGERLVAWDYLLQAGAYDPARNVWSELSRLPFSPSECYPESVFVGRLVFAWYCGQAAILRPGCTRWEKVRPPSRSVTGAPVATRERVLFPGIGLRAYTAPG